MEYRSIALYVCRRKAGDRSALTKPACERPFLCSTTWRDRRPGYRSVNVDPKKLLLSSKVSGLSWHRRCGSRARPRRVVTIKARRGRGLCADTCLLQKNFQAHILNIRLLSGCSAGLTAERGWVLTADAHRTQRDGSDLSHCVTMQAQYTAEA